MENWVLNIIYLVMGAALTLIITCLIDWRKERKAEKGRHAKEMQMLISITQEIRKGIDRGKYYVQLSEDSPPKISFSKLYTQFGEVWIKDLVQISDDHRTLRNLHDIYEKFFFINMNIDANNYGAAVAFAKQYLPSTITNHNSVVREILKKKRDWSVDIHIPDELTEISDCEK